MSNWIVRVLQYVLPKRFWYRNIYLWSNHWRTLRQRKIRSVGHKCEKCKKGRYRLDVHHLTYERIFHERLSDLQVLCRVCHKKEHYE